MNIGLYTRCLIQAALDTRHANIHDANAMERFFLRRRWMYSGEEASWVLAAVSVSGWASVAEQVLAEQREMRGQPVDKRRFGKHSTAVGLGIRALMMPHYFLRKALRR